MKRSRTFVKRGLLRLSFLPTFSPRSRQLRSTTRFFCPGLKVAIGVNGADENVAHILYVTQQIPPVRLSSRVIRMITPLCLKKFCSPGTDTQGSFAPFLIGRQLCYGVMIAAGFPAYRALRVGNLTADVNNAPLPPLWL